MNHHVDRDIPVPVPLLDEDQLAALLGIDVADLTDTDRIAALATSALIQNYTDRQLVRGTYTERHLGQLQGSVQLLEYPVVSITSIREVINGSASATDVVGYRLVRPTGIVLGWWGCELEVVYVAGYDPLPADLVAAFMEGFRTVRAVQAMPDGASLVKRVAVTGVGSVDYDLGASGLAGSGGWAFLPPTSVALLAPYRNTAPMGVG